jgi:hypothetical protein
MCTFVAWLPTVKNGVIEAKFFCKIVPVTYYVLKSTLNELNSFAVRLTSELCMSVLTSLRNSLRLFLMKCIIILNLFADIGF